MPVLLATRPGASARRSGTGWVVLVLALVTGVVAGCSSEADPASSNSSTSASLADQGDYGYGPDAFTSCLDAHSIDYRNGDDGQLNVVGLDDPSTQQAVDDCQTATTMPATAELNAYQNDVTHGIAECLKDAGYHVTEDLQDTGLTDAEGRTATTFTVPQAEQDLPEYSADNARCTEVAAAAAGPAPTPGS